MSINLIYDDLDPYRKIYRIAERGICLARSRQLLLVDVVEALVYRVDVDGEGNTRST
ncbi:hypothetical protein ACMHYB_43515 [Sorangium sp. So ce1128]